MSLAMITISQLEQTLVRLGVNDTSRSCQSLKSAVSSSLLDVETQLMIYANDLITQTTPPGSN